MAAKEEMYVCRYVHTPCTSTLYMTISPCHIAAASAHTPLFGRYSAWQVDCGCCMYVCMKSCWIMSLTRHSHMWNPPPCLVRTYPLHSTTQSARTAGSTTAHSPGSRPLHTRSDTARVGNVLPYILHTGLLPRLPLSLARGLPRYLDAGSFSLGATYRSDMRRCLFVSFFLLFPLGAVRHSWRHASDWSRVGRLRSLLLRSPTHARTHSPVRALLLPVQAGAPVRIRMLSRSRGPIGRREVLARLVRVSASARRKLFVLQRTQRINAVVQSPWADERMRWVDGWVDGWMDGAKHGGISRLAPSVAGVVATRASKQRSAAQRSRTDGKRSPPPTLPVSIGRSAWPCSSVWLGGAPPSALFGLGLEAGDAEAEPRSLAIRAAREKASETWPEPQPAASSPRRQRRGRWPSVCQRQRNSPVTARYIGGGLLCSAPPPRTGRECILGCECPDGCSN